MNKYLQANKHHWNDLTDAHVGPDSYDLDSFVAAWRMGKITAAPGSNDLGDLKGMSLLHLQCHFGLDSLRLQYLGAQVTGVDLSDRSIEVAQETAYKLGVDAVFHQADVLSLSLPEQFDIVYTSLGVLCWLPDLTSWAKVIARHLQPGGFFYMLENHPFAYVLDDENEMALQVRYPYFHSEEPLCCDGQGSYAAPDEQFDHPISYEWTHSLSDVFTALLDAGLIIQSFQESPICGYRMLPCMVETDEGWMLPEDMSGGIPLTFTIKARKPEEAEQGGQPDAFGAGYL